MFRPTGSYYVIIADNRERGSGGGGRIKEPQESIDFRVETRSKGYARQLYAFFDSTLPPEFDLHMESHQVSDNFEYMLARKGTKLAFDHEPEEGRT